MRKIENFVRSRCYAKNISKDERKIISENICWNFKIIDGYQT